MMNSLPRYDIGETYRWNYEHAPDVEPCEAAHVPGDWDFCGRSVHSPLGISAGPLLNGKWCLYYAALGFDVLTYKTVRSGQRDCYEMPNLQPVDCGSLTGVESRVMPSESMRGSWAVSFGMPSSEPEVWRRDIGWTRQHLPDDKVLSVSVVGTIQDGWSMEQLADDYAVCARWAVESGADCIEANFSCPNVATCDGQLYQDPIQSRLVAQAVRSQIGSVPFIIKIGHVPSQSAIDSLLGGVADVADALAMTNSIATTVGSSNSQMLFKGQRRGICGEAIRDASIAQVSQFRAAIQRGGHAIRLIGVGGIRDASHVREYLDAGAHACHLASEPMVHPAVGLEIRESLGT